MGPDKALRKGKGEKKTCLMEMPVEEKLPGLINQGTLELRHLQGSE